MIGADPLPAYENGVISWIRSIAGNFVWNVRAIADETAEIVRFALTRRMVVFLVVGGTCFLLAEAVLYFLIYQYDLEHNTANWIAIAIVGMVNFYLNFKFTWKDRRCQIKASFGRFIPVKIGGLLLDALLFAGIVAIWDWPLLAKALVTLIVMGYNWYAKNTFVFPHQKPDSVQFARL